MSTVDWIYDQAKNLATVTGIDYESNKSELLVVVAMSEVKRMRQENADLRAESQSLSARLKRIEDVIWNVK